MTQADFSEVRDSIVAADQIFVAAFSQGDAAGMSALYTDDAQILPPNAEPVVGRPAIQGFWQTLMDMGITEAIPTTVEVEALGDTAIEVGTYALEVEDGQVVDRGKYIVVWKQENEQWKLHRDIFNSSMPAPGA